MAYSPIAFTAANYRDYKFNWLKAYEPGTTTPKAMGTDSTLSAFISKAQVNIDGFFVSAGGTLITPYVDGTYDLWLFPTEAEAEANDTSSALRLADAVTGAADLAEAISLAPVSEVITLIDGQTVVTFPTQTTAGAEFHINGIGVDSRMLTSLDYNEGLTTSSTITLFDSYPAGSVVTLSKNTSSGASSVARDFVHNEATLDAAIAATNLVVGDSINLAERSTGNGGGAMWDVVLSTTVTENLYNIVQCTGVPTLSLVLRVGNEINPSQFGAVGDGVIDDTLAMQFAINQVSFGGVFRLQRGAQYKLTSTVYIQKTGQYFGDGTFHDKPEFNHHWQIFCDHNGPAFILDSDTSTLGTFSDFRRRINGFSFRSDKTTYPRSCGFASTQTSLGTVIESCIFNNVAYGICPTTSYGMVIQNNLFLDCLQGVSINPMIYTPIVAPVGGTMETNVIRILNNKISTGGGIGIDINVFSNSIIIEGNTIESNDRGIIVSSAVGAGSNYSPGRMKCISIRDNYFELNATLDVQIGRDDFGTISNSGPQVLTLTGNNFNVGNKSLVPVKIFAVQDGVFLNDMRNFTLITDEAIYDFVSPDDVVNVNVDLTNFKYRGSIRPDRSSKVKSNQWQGRETPIRLNVDPASGNSVTGNNAMSYQGGTVGEPFETLDDAMNYINMFQDQFYFLSNSLATPQITITGNVGPMPSTLSSVYNFYKIIGSASGGSIEGGNIRGADVKFSGNITMILPAGGGGFNPLFADGARVAFKDTVFDYTGYTGGAKIINAINGATVVMDGCTEVAAGLPLVADASIIFDNSPLMVGARTTSKGGQIFT